MPDPEPEPQPDPEPEVEESSTNKPVSTDEKFDASYSYVSQSNICKATSFFEEKDHSVSSGSATECDTTLC